MSMSKKILSAVLAVLFGLITLSLPAISQSTESGAAAGVRDFNYSVNADGSVTITGLRGTGSRIAVPAMIDGRPVREIGEGSLSGRTDLRGLYLSEGISVIGKSAFEGCSSLEGLVLPSTLKEVGERAFSGCSSADYVILPEGLTVLGADAFSDCRSLEVVVVTNPSASALYGAGCFGVNPGTAVYAPDGSTAAARAAAGGVSCGKTSTAAEFIYSQSSAGLTVRAYTGSAPAIVVPREIGGRPVIAVDDGAFSPFMSNAAGAVIVCLPDSVKMIGASAFAGSAELLYVRMPLELEGNIGRYTFKNCASLRKIEIPRGVRSIGTEAFMGCTALFSAVFPESLEYISAGAFRDCSALESLICYGAQPECQYINSLPQRVSFAGVEKMTVYVRDESLWQTDGGRWHANGKTAEYVGFEVIGLECGHFFLEDIIVPINCAAEGIIRFECPFCGESYTETYPKTAHTYKSTGIVDGIETHRCTVCGNSYMKFHITHAVIKPVIDTTKPKGGMMTALSITFRGTAMLEGVDYTVREEYSERYGRVELTFSAIGDFVGERKIAYYITTGNYAVAFSVSAEGGEGGGKYFPGDLVTIKPTKIPTGMEVGGWSITGADLMSQSKIAAVFEMPERDVTVKINLVPIPETEPVTETTAQTEPATEPVTSEDVLTAPPTDTAGTTAPGTELLPPDSEPYMRRAIIWGALLFVSLAAMITAGIFMFRNDNSSSDDKEDE